MAAIDPGVVRARLDAVITALKETGAWEVVRPREEAFADAGAFGMKTMALEQWLRFVFVANVEALIAAGGPWPESSSVAVHAVREWDGWERADGPLAALRRFDALFRPDAMTAAEHNQAGWELLKTGVHFDDAMTYFRAAFELAPDDGVPLANLCDALVAAGRGDEAIATAERETTGPRAAAAHNWLGWRLMNHPETLSHAIDHLYAATQARPAWGVARMNFGKALELAHRADEAFVQLSLALRCDGDFDRAFCHERIGAYHARHGWFRNALVAMRAALRADSGARRAPYEEGIAWIEQQLRAAGVEPPEDETRKAWAEACERELPPGFMAAEWGDESRRR